MAKFDHEWYGPKPKINISKLMVVISVAVVVIAVVAGLFTAEWRKQVLWQRFNQERTAFATFQNLSFYDVGGEVVVEVYSYGDGEAELTVGDE